jgi:hypothetical protein
VASGAVDVPLTDDIGERGRRRAHAGSSLTRRAVARAGRARPS